MHARVCVLVCVYTRSVLAPMHMCYCSKRVCTYAHVDAVLSHVCASMLIGVCVSTYVCALMLVYVLERLCACMLVCVLMYAFLCSCIYLQACMCAYRSCMHTYVQVSLLDFSYFTKRVLFSYAEISILRKRLVATAEK